MNHTTSIIPSQPNPQFHIFNFNGIEIRAFVDTDNEACFIAADVCKGLDVDNISHAVSRLDSDEKRDIVLNDSAGRANRMLAVTESGMYSLVLSSRKPVAKDFKRWITHNVLPQIRKSGNYINPNVSALDVLKQMVTTLETQQTQIDNLDNRVTSLESHTQYDVEYFTVMGYFNKEHLLAPSLNEAQSIGMRASRLSRDKGYSIGKTSDPRFGEVNTYHYSILDEIVNK